MKNLLKLIILFALLCNANMSYAYDFDDWGDSESEGAENLVIEETSDQIQGVINMEGEFLDDDLLRISVNTKDLIVPVLGIAFHLIYDPQKLIFLKYEQGDFLEKGGDPFYLAQSNKNGNIFFGETLRHDDSFPTGEGKISDFYFQIINGDKFDFKFDRGIISTLDVTRQDIDKIDWQDFSMENGPAKKLLDYIKPGVLLPNNEFSAYKSHLSTILALLTIVITMSIVIVFVFKLRQKIAKEKTLGDMSISNKN